MIGRGCLKEETLDAIKIELSKLYGNDLASAIVKVEMNRAGGNRDKLLSNIRNVLVKVGGEKYASDIHTRLLEAEVEK